MNEKNKRLLNILENILYNGNTICAEDDFILLKSMKILLTATYNGNILEGEINKYALYYEVAMNYAEMRALVEGKIPVEEYGTVLSLYSQGYITNDCRLDVKSECFEVYKNYHKMLYVFLLSKE